MEFDKRDLLLIAGLLFVIFFALFNVYDSIFFFLFVGCLGLYGREVENENRQKVEFKVLSYLFGVSIILIFIVGVYFGLDNFFYMCLLGELFLFMV